ncbi:GNAT family N-acetyltransferase [Iamia majanohamensis]|uniref:GNAT family N-acetyltransferase n=1 Tax=Iamia majanohamensis TaxID=467976 RepID=A0AAE9YBN6_9ACTN|nr:GNAT family N-acetyltransferase [Iamia majanohamensis]WCO66062.1 GNAT family N-acetyltransferase [Iamia majanohamensis]
MTDHDDADRYEVHVDGALAGYADRHVADGTMVLPHTVVDPRFRGRGLAARLVRRALDDARARDLAVAPACSYVADFLAHHPDDLDLVPAPERPRYGL